MKKSILSILLIAIVSLTFTSCKKGWEKPKDDFKVCSIEESTISSDKNYEDVNKVEAGIKQYILKDIVVDPSCNCITQGYVKYVKNGKTAALVDYSNKNCDGWAVKTMCVNGDCDENSSCFKFQQTCTTLEENSGE